MWTGIIPAKDGSHFQFYVHHVVKLHPNVTTMSFCKAWGRFPDNNVSVVTQRSMYLKRNMKLIHFSISPCEIDGQGWREGLQGTKTDRRSSGFHYFTSKQCGRCNFLFSLSDYLILLSAIRIFFSSSSCTWIFILHCVCMHMCNHAWGRCQDYRLVNAAFCDRNYETRNTDTSCFIIHTSVTTMHFLNLGFWQMAFSFWNVFHFTHSVSKIDVPPPSEFWLLLWRRWDECWSSFGFYLRKINKWVNTILIKQRKHWTVSNWGKLSWRFCGTALYFTSFRFLQ